VPSEVLRDVIIWLQGGFCIGVEGIGCSICQYCTMCLIASVIIRLKWGHEGYLAGSGNDMCQ